MNSPNPKDLLSAFYDREVAPEEEAAAQAQVQRSPEAGREVKDYARLTRLLQQLPQAKAPPEFAAAVMRRAERESLIPLDPAAPQPAADPVGAESPWLSGRRQWIVAGLAGASIAAVALIAVMYSGHSGARPASHGELVAAAPPTPGPALAKRLTARAEPTSGKSHELALMLPANLKTARVGEVVEALQQDGQQVAVVRLTVVNQVEGLDGVQSVLVRNTSRTLQNADEIKRMRQQFGADKSGEVPKSALRGASGEFICVYAQGSRDEMVGVLHDLQNESHFRAAELTNTIPLSALEQYAHAVPPQKPANTPAVADNPAPGAPTAQAAAKSAGSQLAVSLPASAVDKIISAKQGPVAVGGTQKSRSLASGNEQQSQVAAAPAPPTPELAQKESDRLAPANKAAAGTRPTAAASPRSRADRDSGLDLLPKEEIASGGKSFQIFFVITDQAPAQGTPPAAAAAKPAVKPAPAAAPSKTAPVPVWSRAKKRPQ